MEKKCLQKYTGQFVLCWPSTPGMQPPSSVIDIPRESPLAKTGFSSVGFTLRLTSWVVMGLRVHFPLLGLGPHLVLYLLVWSVNSYVHSSSCVWETVFPCSYYHLCLLHVTRVALLFTTEFWLYLQTS